MRHRKMRAEADARGVVVGRDRAGNYIRKDILDQARAPFKDSDDSRVMDACYFRPSPIGLQPWRSHPLSHWELPTESPG